MLAIIETDRLVLRPFGVGDAEAAHAWFGDPVVMRYTPTGPDQSVQKTRERLARYQAHQEEHGFSKWAFEAETSAEVVEWARALGLTHLLNDLPAEQQRAWEKDFASELERRRTGGVMRLGGVTRLVRAKPKS